MAGMIRKVAGVAGMIAVGAALPGASAAGRPEVPSFRALQATTGATGVKVSCPSIAVSGAEAKGFDGRVFNVNGLANDNSLLYSTKEGDAKMFSVTGPSTRSWFMVSDDLPYFLAASGPKADYVDATDMDASMWQMLSSSGVVDVEASDIIVSCVESETTMTPITEDKPANMEPLATGAPVDVAFNRLLQATDCMMYEVSGAAGLNGVYTMNEGVLMSPEGGYISITPQDCSSGMGGLDGAEMECLDYVVYMGNEALDYAFVAQADAMTLISEVLPSVWRIDYDCTSFSMMFDFDVMIPADMDSKLDQCSMSLVEAADIMLMCSSTMAPTGAPTSSPTTGGTIAPTVITDREISPASSHVPTFLATGLAIIVAAYATRRTMHP